jgi:hypothetical protein
VHAIGSWRLAGGLSDGASSHRGLGSHQLQSAGGEQADTTTAVRRGDCEPACASGPAHLLATMIGM